MEILKAVVEKVGKTLGVEVKTMTREEVLTVLLWSEIENLACEVSEPEIFDE